MKKSTATEAYRVASEIVAIRAALKERGYRIHKQPKQAVWKITPLSPPLVRGETNALNPPLASGETNALNPPLVRGEINALNPPLVRGETNALNPPLASGEKKALSPPKTTTSPSPPLTRGAGGVSRDTDEYYLLTYQPAPISAWVLHLENNEPDCQIIETIIQSATKKQLANTTRKAS
ncbi:MAG TPA: hypothetical protein V6D14_25410 [Coleofasciculaceae cyanobacterium]